MFGGGAADSTLLSEKLIFYFYHASISYSDPLSLADEGGGVLTCKGDSQQREVWRHRVGVSSDQLVTNP